MTDPFAPLPVPLEGELPPAWSDMNGTERAMFVYRWRLERGYLKPRETLEDALVDAGFEVVVYHGRCEG